MRYKYSAAAETIRRRLLSGEYGAGAKLPSIQTLTREMSCSAETIIKAYRQLEAEHFVYAVPKSGYYAVKCTMGRNNANAALDLQSVRPPDSINPYADYCHCLAKATALYGLRLFEYGPPQGMPELRQLLSRHLMGSQVFSKPENIFITNGAQQALAILSALQFGAGDTVLVEQPTYSVMLQLLNCNAVPVCGIARNAAGIDLDQLEQFFRRGDIKFFYLMPRFQNPSGFSYTQAQKKAILQLAARYGVYIVEDDYLAELETDSRVVPLYASAERDIVIYVKSFSKTLLPGLRLGMCILPPALQNEFLRRKQCADLGSSILTQGALEIFLKSRMYRFHAQRTRQHYQDQMTTLRNACAELNTERIVWHIPDSGLYASAELHGICAATLVKRLAKRGILVSSLDDSYLPQQRGAEGIRLCVCNLEADALRRSVAEIAREVQRMR